MPNLITFQHKRYHGRPPEEPQMALTRKPPLEWLMGAPFPQDLMILNVIVMDKHDYDNLRNHFHDHYGENVR